MSELLRYKIFVTVVVLNFSTLTLVLKCSIECEMNPGLESKSVFCIHR